MKAEKGNKVYTITEKERASYVADGFDIYDEDGKLIASGKGKTVSVEEYEKLKARNQELEAYVADGFDIYDEDGKLIASGKGKTVSVEEYEKLKARNQELEAALAKTRKKVPKDGE